MIIEDEPSIRDELMLLLENEGYDAHSVTDFKEIPMQIEEAQPDLILLDLGLPGRDGFTLCVDIRRASSIPIIFVTSRNTAMDELRALSMGGDDYITKPYNIPLLLARIKTVLRRSSTHAEPDIVEANGLTLYLAQGISAANGKSAELTRNEIRILAHLLGVPGQIVSRADLIEVLWNNQIYIDDNTLSVNITRLRSKLDSMGMTNYIKTRHGLGYQI